ncbi:MAG: ATP-grasp domain-containing protein [Thermoleophilia bacterium]|nr:ATP-grasp domain-containing protein [Thermoleophilia bacterium]
MRPLCVLVTASGAPGTAALLRALKGNGEREIRLVGCDMAERAIGRHLCDAFQRVPPGSSPLFASTVLELSRRERVDAVLPQSSHDLAGLAAARPDFASEGVAVLVSSPQAVATADDKAACYELLDGIGVRVPRWRRVQGGRELARAAGALGYPGEPVCFKPVRSSGSRGFRVLDATVDRLDQLLHERPGALAMRLEEVVELLPEVGGEELLVMEYVEGAERTIDGIALGGRLLLGHPKTREAMRAGLAMFFQTLEDDSLMEVARRVVAGLGLDHFFNVQLRGDAVIEVNPRISTVVYQDDLNLPYLGLKHALGELDADELALLARRVRPTRRALRFFDQLEWDDQGC